MEEPGFIGSFETLSWNDGAYPTVSSYGAGVVATITIASDSEIWGKILVKSSRWYAPAIGGAWSAANGYISYQDIEDIKDAPNNKMYIFTPKSGMASTSTSVLPESITASVTVDMDPSITGNVGNYFMSYYAYKCTYLTSLGVPNTNAITSAGDYFMNGYAYQCAYLTTLDVPDTSKITSVGSSFMSYYAYYCYNLPTLGALNTSKITSVGSNFMGYYAYRCQSLKTLNVPDTSKITSVGYSFMYYYASYCTSLTSLGAPDLSSLENATVSDFLNGYASNCTSLKTLDVPNISGLISVGAQFMNNYASYCTSLTSLGAPDISSLESTPASFMMYYASMCTSLTSLDVPDTSGITSVGVQFMSGYAWGCTALTSIGVPDTSGLTSAGTNFMGNFASYCPNLTKLVATSGPGWLETHPANWGIQEDRLGELSIYVPLMTKESWDALTVDGNDDGIVQKTAYSGGIWIDGDPVLYQNYIQSTENVIGTVGKDEYQSLGQGVVATMTVASDSPLNGKTLVQSSKWYAPAIGGTWSAANATISSQDIDDIRSAVNNRLYIFTPAAGFMPEYGAVLPNIKADVVVDMDPTITSAPSMIMHQYAYGCDNLLSLGVPDTSNLTSVDWDFMSYYAAGCSSITSLGVPDTSGITEAGGGFLSTYATDCTSLTSLDAPDTSGLTETEFSFMGSYAYGCTSLTSLGVPNTSNMTSVENGFMGSYAGGCTSLTSLDVPDTSKISIVLGGFLTGYAAGCTELISLGIPDTSSITEIVTWYPCFMTGWVDGYASDCPNLTKLIAKSGPEWFEDHPTDWGIQVDRLGELSIEVPMSTKTAWDALTVSTKGNIPPAVTKYASGDPTLYQNYIQSTDNVTVGDVGDEYKIVGKGVIATMTVASDSATTAKTLVKDSKWFAPALGGTWSAANATISSQNITDIKDAPNNKLYIFTPMTGMSSTSTSVLPEGVKASVTVDMDPSITNADDNFMHSYAKGCALLTSLDVPDTINITSAGNNFMLYYANGCTTITSLGIPDTSEIISVGNGFMSSYAQSCKGLTHLGAPNIRKMQSIGNNFMYMYAMYDKVISLDVPDTSGLTSVGNGFMANYARECTALTSLDVPDTSNVKGSVGNDFMNCYAFNCMKLTSLGVPNISGITSVGNNFMSCYIFYGTALTSLGVPDTSNLKSVGNSFMVEYASYCGNLTSLEVPDTSKLTSAGSDFMKDYAIWSNKLTRLVAKSEPKWFATHPTDWGIAVGRLGHLKIEVPKGKKAAWAALTVSTEGNIAPAVTKGPSGDPTLYQNYIQSTKDVDENWLSYSVIATMTVAPDAVLANTKYMEQGSMWVAPALNDVSEDVDLETFVEMLSNEELTIADRTLEPEDIEIIREAPNNKLYILTPVATYTNPECWSVLPNIKADVIVDMDPSMTVAPSALLANYASGCDQLTSLGVPDTSNLTKVGAWFMLGYASGCSSLTSLDVPDTSNITETEYQFMDYYAYGCTSLTSLGAPDVSGLTALPGGLNGYASGCTSLTSLDVPDISGLTSGAGFMSYYAYGCTSLTSLDVPDISGIKGYMYDLFSSYAQGCTSLTSLGIPDTTGITDFSYSMSGYAYDCTSLTTLVAKSAPGWFATHPTDWGIQADRLGELSIEVPKGTKAAWDELTVSTKGNIPPAVTKGASGDPTLYQNYIQSEDNVIEKVALDVSNSVVATMTVAPGAVLAGPKEMEHESIWFAPGLDDISESLNIEMLVEKAINGELTVSKDPITPEDIEIIREASNNKLYIVTPVSGFEGGEIAVLPNIKADVVVDMDPSITNAGNWFMLFYANGCDNLKSLGVPDTSGLTEVGNSFMFGYAQCTSLKSLGVPDISGLTEVGNYFMGQYAYYCTSLTTLDVPDASRLAEVGDGFMYRYATYCSSLKSLGIPDISSLTQVGNSPMVQYADYANKLTRLVAKSGPGWFEDHPTDWGIQEERLDNIRIVVPEGTKAAWAALAVDGNDDGIVQKGPSGDPTLYQNYIQYVVGTGTEGYSKIEPIAATGLIYNGDDQNLLISGSLSDAGAVRYYATTEDIDINTVIERYLDGEQGFYTQFASIKGKDAGEYTVWYFDATDIDAHEASEEITSQCSVPAEIARKAITVTAKDATKFFGEEDIDSYTTTKFTVTGGFVGSDNIEGVTLTLSGAITGEDRPVGTYNITPSAAVFDTGLASNYNITYVNGQYVVKPLDPVENDEGEKIVVKGNFIFENMQEVPGTKTYAERLQTVGQYDDSKIGYKDIMLGVAPTNNEDRMEYYSYATGASVNEETGEVTLTFDNGMKLASAVSNYTFIISAPGLTAVIVNSASLSYEDNQFTLDLTAKGELRMYAGLNNFNSETFKIDTRLLNEGMIKAKIGVSGPQFDYNQILSASDEANVFIKAYQALDIDGDGRLTASDIIFLEQNYGKKPMQFNY